MIGRNDLCWCKSGKKWKKCCYPRTPVPEGREELAQQYKRQYNIHLKSDQEIEGVRASCHLTAKILRATVERAKTGVTTNELDRYAAQLMEEAGARSAALHYGTPPFPKSICTSLNEIVCHGIPNDRPLEEGDILNIDLFAQWKGYYGDCSAMVIIGKTTPERKKVVEVSYDAMMEAISICKPGLLISEIGAKIVSCAESHQCSVVYEFVGHGVGLEGHEPPQIPHSLNRVHIPLVPGMIFTIEPMINAGVPETVMDPEDGWTVRTKDGLPSAQWEHTVLITEEGYEILTLPERL